MYTSEARKTQRTDFQIYIRELTYEINILFIPILEHLSSHKINTYAYDNRDTIISISLDSYTTEIRWGPIKTSIFELAHDVTYRISNV